jgi:hypothetical protein
MSNDANVFDPARENVFAEIGGVRSCRPTIVFYRGNSAITGLPKALSQSPGAGE